MVGGSIFFSRERKMSGASLKTSAALRFALSDNHTDWAQAAGGRKKQAAPAIKSAAIIRSSMNPRARAAR
jgi:hypothetical protein